MKFLAINSYYHYQFCKKGKLLAIREYPDTACPAMDQRPPFKAQEGRDLATLRPDEFLQLDYGGPFVAEGRVSASIADKGVFCGDDLPYQLVREKQ